MSTANHSKRAHALLSCSGSSRWMNCSPSARLEEAVKQEGSSDFAKEGTLAHELAELNLLMFRDQLDAGDYQERYLAITGSKFYAKDMDGYVDVYTDYVIETFNASTDQSKILSIEDELDLTEYIPEGFGTGDAAIISGNKLSIFDLKYGRGVKVEASNNSQLKLYALGYMIIYQELYGIEEVEMNIVQPRMHSISTETMSAEDLMQWARKTVKPAAKKAYEGKGVQKAGSWCRWCKVKGRCATLAAHALKAAKSDFGDPRFLNDKQIVEVYEQTDTIEIWIKAVREYMLKEALSGKQWDGYKVVEGQARRKWKNEEEAKEHLLDNLYEEHDVITSKIKGIGDIEKLIGKNDFSTFMGEHVIKPQGAPTLVPVSDKRPALGIEQAKEDFGE